MEGYTPNFYSGLYNLVLGHLESADEHFKKARLAANPVDRSLDAMESAIAILRGEVPQLSVEEWIAIAEEERVSYFVSRELLGLLWKDEKTIVAVFDLAIEQRVREVHDWLFGPKPSLMPEADWHRIKELAGVTQFQSNRLAQRAITQYVARNFLV
jgi:hypothetical protein